jgi:hypothetical protein
MVHQAVDRRRRGHRVLEDPIPLAEHDVARDDHALAFVARGEEREEHLHLVAALLHVAEVVQDHGVVGVERGEFLLQVLAGVKKRQKAVSNFGVERGRCRHLVSKNGDERFGEGGDEKR